MAKVTLPEFRTYMQSKSTAVTDTARLQSALDAADRAIDQACGRAIFVAADTATARVYRPNGSCHLPIHDCTSITSVVENGTTLTSGTDYVAEPLNGLTWAGETVPYSNLSRYLASWYMDGPKATVTVTARWGWATVPAPIAEACKMLARDIATSRERTGDVVGFGEFGAVRIRQSPQILGLIAPYRRVEAFGIA